MLLFNNKVMLDFSKSKRVVGAVHWYHNVDQFYHPSGEFGQDGNDLVYSFDLVNTNKFTPILLKEWFYLVKKGGYLILDYFPSSSFNTKNLEQYMWWLWKGKYDVVFHNFIKSKFLGELNKQNLQKFADDAYGNPNVDISLSEKKGAKRTLVRFICKKKEDTLLVGDSIDKWSFGIVTNGKRLDWIEQIIDSIRKLKIKNYEIIVCGDYYNRRGKFFKYIPFNLRSDQGWITKKKNLIAEKAKYENLCVIHDRLVFNKDWFIGMKKWGNCFDHLSGPQLLDNGERASDWSLREKYLYKKIGLYGSFMDYRDWDLGIYASGQLHILKRSHALKYKWNESFLWGDPEDVELTENMNSHGHILRFNPYSGFRALAYRFGHAPEVPFDSVKLSRLRKVDFGKLIKGRLNKILGR